MHKVAILDDYQNVATSLAGFDRLAGSCDITVFNEPLGHSDDDVIAALQEFDVLCCMRERTPLNAARIARLGNLKLIVTTGSRNAAIDTVAAGEQGITVCGTRSPGHAASELAWALVLGLQRQLVAEDRSMRNGEWQTTVGRDCKDQVLGLVGLGRHGANVARYGQAFGMRCIAWSTNLSAERCAELNVELVDKHTLFSEADVISVHLVLGSRNRNLIGASELQAMKSDAIIINTSRGPIIDESALLDALNSGSIGGAGLDVYEHEPLPSDHPLRSSPRTLLTSHVGFVTEQTYRIFYEDTLEAIEAWLAGSPIRTLGGR